MDIVVGPLFTSAVQKHPIIAASSIPVLFQIISSQLTGNCWAICQNNRLTIYWFAVGRTRQGLLYWHQSFGDKFLGMLLNDSQFGLQPAQAMMLAPAVLADDDSLKRAIKIFSRYKKPETDGDPLPEPAMTC